MNNKQKSFFRLVGSVESAEAPAEIPSPVELPLESEQPTSTEIAATSETEAQIHALGERATALENLADIAEHIPVADENHAMLVELAAEQAVAGTDIELETEVVPALESAIGGRINTTGIRTAAATMRSAQKALQLNVGLESAFEFDTGIEGIGSDLAGSVRKLFSAWKDDSEARDVWSYGSKEIIAKLRETYGNAEWVKMRGLKEGEIKLPKGGWAEYLIMPDGKLSPTEPNKAYAAFSSALGFALEACGAYREYKKAIAPVYNKTISQSPQAALEYAREELSKLPMPAARMKTKELKLPADRFIKLNASGTFFDDWQESELPDIIPVLGSEEAVAAAAKVCIKAAEELGAVDLSYPNFYGEGDFGFWNKAYRELAEPDFNWLWRSFNSQAIHSSGGLETAMIKAMYSGLAAIQALEIVLDRSVK